MVICLERGANDLHMVQLMPLPPHRLLLQYNTRMVYLSGASLLRAVKIVVLVITVVVVAVDVVMMLVFGKHGTFYIKRFTM